MGVLPRLTHPAALLDKELCRLTFRLCEQGKRSATQSQRSSPGQCPQSESQPAHGELFHSHPGLFNLSTSDTLGSGSSLLWELLGAF